MLQNFTNKYNNSTTLYTPFQHSTQLYNTLHNFYNNYKTVQHLKAQLSTTIHTLHTTIQHSVNFITLCTTLQYFPQILNIFKFKHYTQLLFYIVQHFDTTLQYSTQLCTTLHNQKHTTQLYKLLYFLQNCTKMLEHL